LGLFISILLLSCSNSSDNNPATGDDTTTIVILHTNDNHSTIDNYGRLAALVKDTKATNDHVFLLCAGDIFTGNAVVDYYPKKYYPSIDLMNMCSYDVTCLGNHSFDSGLDTLAARIDDANFQYLCANADFSQCSQDIKTQASIKLYAGNIILKVVGILERNSNGYPDTKPSNCGNAIINDPIEVMKEVALQEDAYNCLIALTHLGYDTDKYLASQVPNIDVIIGGHSHTVIDNPQITNGALITQAGSHIKYCGKITLVFDSAGKLIERKGELIDLATYPNEDTAIAAKIATYDDAPYLDEIIAYNEVYATRYQLAYMMTDAVKDYTQTDMCFLNSNGVRMYYLQQGDITLGDVLTLDPFNNGIVTFELDSAELHEFIRKFYGKKYYGEKLACSDGVSYTISIDASDSTISDIHIDFASGINKNAISISTSDYITESVAYPSNDKITVTGDHSNEMLLAFLKKQKSINYSKIDRVIVK
jgi:2',3'-cyclic-nucleotide 2'-phosphodiesterase (5'-nucleotidase family)